ncbi:hypothetical protein NCER_101555 [Vairimorpha ceranae BRL01]|uniref:Uncharacterized protein n=2 Tax=Vairimorpha ceranae TaxID=40302 RepID=C4VAA1_VAIC1|nr:hypothetical protein AAJ76_400083012 [Vairimorpha ceranae]EEQ81848.1 hypothetical protein NCER_101555 [Vairimorpha ceranae BRL01]KAF5141390.1 hypothetical protein G9O61_00g007070 [Vairimorpha ceranae]KKO76336.1 hypothetical protein AAJ76_400083012 [Vairimorpha ceranae]
MLKRLENILNITASASQTAKLLETTTLNLLKTVLYYYKDKYKIFIKHNINNEDLIGLALIAYCDINNIKIEDNIIDFYYDVILNNRLKDEDILDHLIKENEELRNKLEIEHAFIKQAWYEMCETKTKFE